MRKGTMGKPVHGCKMDPYISGFELGRIIGSGMIGLAYAAKHVETGEIFCLKCMSQDKIAEKNLVKNIENEIKFHLELADVPTIMPLLKMMVCPLEIVMVFPYIPGRDLFRFMRSREGPNKGHLSEYESQIVTKQLLSALQACHSRGILHRDIKPENIMINSNLEVWLSDLGLAIQIPANGSYTGRAGTPCYYPYEMVKGQSYDFRADIWCLGVLLVEMLYGQLPFSADKNRDYAPSIANLDYKLPKDKKVSLEAKDLIQKILVPQAARLSLKGVMEHVWLKKTFDNHQKLV
jgi:serine/threonine protein kinase